MPILAALIIVQLVSWVIILVRHCAQRIVVMCLIWKRFLVTETLRLQLVRRIIISVRSSLMTRKQFVMISVCVKVLVILIRIDQILKITVQSMIRFVVIP